MEKRAFIAVILMFLVLITYNLLVPKRQAPPSPEVSQPVEAEVAVDTVAVEEQEHIDITLPEQAAPARQIVVSTPLYKAVYSSRGGVLTSFSLNNYLTSEEMPVELVPESDSLPLALALLTKTGDRIDLAEAFFAVSAESLRVDATGEASLAFTLADQAGLTVRETYKFRGDSYAIEVGIRVSGLGSEAVRAVEFGWQSGLRTTELNRKDDLRNFAAITLTDERLAKTDLGKVRKNKEVAAGDNVRWSGLKTKYFMAGLVPLTSSQVIARSFVAGDERIGMVLEADQGEAGTYDFLVYAGPLDYEGLKQVGYELEKAVDFGWKWIRPVSKLMFAFMLICHKAIPNYGLVIIVLSALTKLLFYPLTQKSFKSMREMQRIQPAIEELRQKYKNNPQDLNKAMMRLYKERGVNPLGGCLPMLLQMPVFIALFNVLSRTIELRRAPFMLWIRDLSAPDVVARLPFSLPFIGNAVSVLPILMGVAMFLQQKMSSSDPKQAAMTYMLPIVFTVMFFRFPSGLVLYWLVNNVLTIGHQYLMARTERS
jgi:YidC/Oxa1 family membrane protein insertase